MWANSGGSKRPPSSNGSSAKSSAKAQKILISAVHNGCAILNNQPVGFYSPTVLVKDAQRHGLRMKPILGYCHI